ncbi:epoxide hydrolase family protein [Streptomyces nigra]
MSVTQDKTAVAPFKVEFSAADIDELRSRIAATRWPEKETVSDQSQGPQLATMQEVARYWANDYDFGRLERALNAHPNFVTEIEGLDIHFIHARSPHEDALPVIITHGWPGSVIEQMKLVNRLIDPTAHGGQASDAFHVVVPSMPGYGFSGKPTERGWGPQRIAHAWAELMRRLGYTRYVAQGGDWGAVVTDYMGVQAPPELAGIHTNMPGVIPPAIDGALAAGQPLPAGTPDLTAEEQRTVDQLTFVYAHVYYAYMMASRPQALTGLADSPVGLAAFLLDHDAASLALITRAFAGEPTGLTRDDVLDNVTLFWLTNTGVSSGRLYAENTGSFFGAKGVSVPTAVSVFPDELYESPRTWAELAYPNLIHYNRLPEGGHFAAWEQPEHLVNEMRVGFRSLRG